MEYRAAARTPDPEETAVLRDLLDRLLKDEKDRLIVEATAAGYRQKDVRRAVGLSQPGVAKRLKTLRKRAAA